MNLTHILGWIELGHRTLSLSKYLFLEQLLGLNDVLALDFFFDFINILILISLLISDQLIADGPKISRVKSLLMEHQLLFLKSLDFVLTPLRLSFLHQLVFDLAFLFSFLDEDLLDLELDAAQLYNIMLLEGVLLFYVSVGYIPHDKIDFLISLTGVLELLARLCILLVYVLRHEHLLLFCAHFGDCNQLWRFNYVVIAYFLDVEKNLGPLAVLLGKVFVHLMDFASLNHSWDLTGLVSRQLLLLTVSSFVVKEPLGISVPGHYLHIEDVSTHVLIVAISVFVLLRDVRFLTFTILKLNALLFYFF